MLYLLLERLLAPVLLVPPVTSFFLGLPYVKNSEHYIQQGDATPSDVECGEANRDTEGCLEGHHARDAKRDGAQIGKAADNGRHGKRQEDLAHQRADCASVGEGEWRGQDGGLGVWRGCLGRDVELVEDLEGGGTEGEEGGDKAEDLFVSTLVST